MNQEQTIYAKINATKYSRDVKDYVKYLESLQHKDKQFERNRTAPNLWNYLELVDIQDIPTEKKSKCCIIQ